jgi:hypothetical protein
MDSMIIKQKQSKPEFGHSSSFNYPKNKTGKTNKLLVVHL